MPADFYAINDDVVTTVARYNLDITHAALSAGNCLFFAARWFMLGVM
jgi:hypothetical protein